MSKQPLQLFKLTLLVTAEQMAELIMDHSELVDSVAPHVNGDGQRHLPTATAHRRSFVRSGTSLELAPAGANVIAKPGELPRSTMLALQATQKLFAGIKGPLSRGKITAAAAKALADGGLAETSASPSVTDLIRRGYLKPAP